MKKDTPTQTSWAVKITCIISTAIGTGLIVGNGPQLQEYLTELITSNRSSIYSSMYGEELAVMPDLSVWLWYTLTNPTTLCALTIMGGLIAFNKARDIYIGTIFISGISLTAIDLAFNIFASHEKMPNMAENLIFNFLGAIFIAAITLGFLKTTLFISTGDSHKQFKLAIAAATPIVTAIFVCVSTYYASIFFYLPTEARIDITVKTPLSIDYKTDKNEEKKFSIAEKKSAIEGDLTVVAPRGQTSTAIKNTGIAGGKISVELLNGCFPETYLELSKSNEKKIIFNGVKTLEVNIDEGPLDIISKNVHGMFDFKNEEIVSTSLKEAKDNTFEMSRFIANDGESVKSVTYTPRMELYKLYFALPLLKVNEKSKPFSANRQVRLTVNENKYLIQFQPRKMLLNKEPTCSAIDTLTLEKHSRQRVTEMDGIGGIIITGFKSKEEYGLFDSEDTTISFTGINGWVAIDNIKKSTVEYLVEAGMVESLIVREGINSLKIDGIEIATSSPKTLATSKASIHGHQVEPGLIRFYGTTKVAFVDQERANKTRWEKIDIEFKIGLASAFIYLLLKITSITYICIRANKNIYNLE